MSSIAESAHKARVLLLLAVLVMSGCATSVPPRIDPAAMSAYLADKPENLRPYFAAVYRDGRRNLVLNLLETGISALQQGEYEIAVKCFDDALFDIEAIYGNSAAAAKARSLWYREDVKDFKGEPYERAMAYYYRGLLYMKAGDYENARACFRSGILQDGLAEEQQDREDFALLIFLDGWCSQRLGDRQMADAAYAEVVALRPDFQIPADDADCLLIAETGKSPRKVADGIGHTEIKYRRGRNFKDQRVGLLLGDQAIDLYPIEDIYWQAATRGGRPVDKILEGKVVFMQRGMKLGSILTEAGSLATTYSILSSGTGNLGYIGGALSVAGGVSTLVSMSVKTYADVRYWNNLPDAIHVSTLPKSQLNATTGAFAFYSQAGTQVGLPNQKLDLWRDSSGSKLGWVRSSEVQFSAAGRGDN